MAAITETSKEKTVYILGAGFSRAAGFPVQSKILDEIRNFPIDIMTMPRYSLDQFEKARETLFNFIGRLFPGDNMPSLEDIFTLLDQTISSKGFSGGENYKKLDEIRDALHVAILFIFHSGIKNIEPEKRELYEGFVDHLIKRRLAAGQKKDIFSIVSLNWDALLEEVLFQRIRERKKVKKIDIDYCCYTTPLTSKCPHYPSILQKEKGIYNIKLMKLHGSTTWLLCPNCNRLYTGVGGDEDVWAQYVKPHKCPQCEKVFGNINAPLLDPFFITPTFLKQFNNPHIQMTWHNAYMDLAEATEVVFMGYSLPEADYHFRTLLRRAINPKAIIQVVLTKNDEIQKKTPKFLHQYLAAERYRAFFGKGRPEILTDGIEGFFQQFKTK